jgi:hypothetical protein
MGSICDLIIMLPLNSIKRKAEPENKYCMLPAVKDIT